MEYCKITNEGDVNSKNENSKGNNIWPKNKNKNNDGKNKKNSK